MGDEPVAARGRAEREGDEAGHAAAPGHADLAGALKFGHDDVRNALERASARQTAAHVAAGAVAKALLARDRRRRSPAACVEIGGETSDDGWKRATDAARADRDTLGGVVEVVAEGVPPGLGSYAEKADRLDARLAAALMGIQAVKGVEIGDGFALARRRGSEAHDEIEPGLTRATNRAGGLEGGVTNGEPVVVRAAMKPLPTLMRPLRSVDLATGEPGGGARRAERRAGGRGARGRRRGRRRVGARARRAREVRRRRARRLRRRAPRVPGADPLAER